MSTSSSADSYAPGLFAGRRILVVGGTSGIGEGIAAAFAALGGEVLVTGATAAEARASGHPAVALDVRDEAAVKAVIAALPALDVLVNCAGIINRAAEHDLAVFAQVLDVNLAGDDAHLRGGPAAAGGDRAAPSSISPRSFRSSAARWCPAYTASKGGVAQLTKALAVAYAAAGHPRERSWRPAGSRRR